MFLGTIDISQMCRFGVGSVSTLKRLLSMSMAVPVTPPSPKGYHKWMPGSRTEQLALALKWDAILDLKGSLWNVPVTEDFNHTIIDKNKYITIKLPVGSIGRRLRASGRYLNAHGRHGQWRPIVEAMVS
ncbi:hypothetical protein FACS1894137_12410 [Spirochaetia bacterium]|nr:hypothetical protein FACS1894137_12410 [Spirochaetia bacterium]